MDTRLKAKEESNKNLQDKVKELESRLMIERNLARQRDSNNGRLPLVPRENFPLMKENNKPVASEVIGSSKLADKTIPLIPKRINRLSFCPKKLDTNSVSVIPKRINRHSICPEKVPVIPSRSSSPSGFVNKQTPQRNILRRSLQKKLVVLRPQQQQDVSGKGCGGGNMAATKKPILMKPRRAVLHVNGVDDKKEKEMHKKRQMERSWNN